MTRFILAGLVLLAFAGSAGATPAADAQALGERFAQAVAAGDIDAVLALYADDARVMFPGAGEEARGKAALRTMLEQVLPAMKTQPFVQKSTDAIAIDDSHILNVGRWETTGAGPDGRKVTTTIRTTEILVKQDGVWRYFVDHASIGLLPPPPARSPSRRRR